MLPRKPDPSSGPELPLCFLALREERRGRLARGANLAELRRESGRGDWIRTSDLLNPIQPQGFSCVRVSERASAESSTCTRRVAPCLLRRGAFTHQLTLGALRPAYQRASRLSASAYSTPATVGRSSPSRSFRCRKESPVVRPASGVR